MTQHESMTRTRQYHHVYKFSGALALDHSPAVAGDTYPHPHGLPFVARQAEAPIELTGEQAETSAPANLTGEQFDFRPDDN